MKIKEKSAWLLAAEHGGLVLTGGCSGSDLAQSRGPAKRRDEASRLPSRSGARGCSWWRSSSSLRRSQFRQGSRRRPPPWSSLGSAVASRHEAGPSRRRTTRSHARIGTARRGAERRCCAPSRHGEHNLLPPLLFDVCETFCITRATYPTGCKMKKKKCDKGS